MGSNERHVILVILVLIAQRLLLEVLDLVSLLVEPLIIEGDIARFSHHIRSIFIVHRITTLNRLVVNVSHVWNRRPSLLELRCMLTHKTWSLPSFRHVDDVIRDVMLRVGLLV